MTDHVLQAQIQSRLEALAKRATSYHATGDVAAKVALVAPDRRSQRHAQNVNRHARAVGEGVGASLWLFGVISKSARVRGLHSDQALPMLDRILADAMVLADDLEFEARIAMGYLPEPAKRPTRRRT
jgi:hypothetical protein